MSGDGWPASSLLAYRGNFSIFLELKIFFFSKNMKVGSWLETTLKISFSIDSQSNYDSADFHRCMVIVGLGTNDDKK